MSDGTPYDLELIDLPQSLVGQQDFIACWLYRDDELTFIVDPGPPATAEFLVAALRERGVRELDFILLTHVHLDHAGGVAPVAAAFPGARVVCHERGRPHVVDPERLWHSSLNVLEKAAVAYGRPESLPADRLAATGDAEARGIRALPTPGHARHHQCYLRGEVLFLGEAAGTFVDLTAGPYLRPATPPRFFLEETLASQDRLLALDPMPRVLAYGHHGLARDRTAELLGMSRAQHVHWVDGVREVLRECGADADFAEQVRRCHERFVESDPAYGLVRTLSAEAREREWGFLEQSLRGLFGYVAGE